jgi:iron complex outermembrane receptor protein
MCSNLKTLAILLLTVGWLLPGWAFGQTGAVRGTVTDSEGEALTGASVVVEGQDVTRGEAADGQGRFRLEGIPAGTYTLQVSFVGYVPSRQQVTIRAGETTQANVVLELSVEAIPEVVVTSQNRPQSLQDVPISATAFTSAQLEEFRVQEIEDYVGLSPNLTFESDGNRGSTDLTIRGVSNLGGQTNAFGVYVDGLNVSPALSRSGINPSLLDVKRIEVLRGPQGTHFGRNTIGGAISITTVKPNATPFYEIGAEYGSFNTIGTHGTANVPLTDDLFVRANAFYEHSDGFIDDLGPADNTNDRDEWGGRLALRYVPTESLTLDATVTRSQFNQGYATKLPNGTVNPALTELGITEPINEGQGFFPENDDQISTDHPFESELTNTRLVGRGEYATETFSVISITGLVQYEFFRDADEDNTSQDAIIRDVTDELSAFSQELRIQSRDEATFTWLLGGNYAYDVSNIDVNAFFGEDFELAPILPGPKPFQFDKGRTERTTESIGLFGEVGTTLWERLDLLAGLRYTHDDVTSEDESELFALVLDPADPNFPGQSLERDTEGSISFDDVSPRFAATYRITETTNVYATVARGYKAGGFNENQLRGNPTFDEESLWNYELGLKSHVFNRRLRVNVTAFWMDWTDLQVNTVDFTTGTAVFDTQNAAEADNAGVEAEVLAFPVEGLKIGGGLGYLDATFDSFPNANVNGEQVDLSGEPLLRAPEWTANGMARYERLLSGGVSGFVQGQVTYTGQHYEDFASREAFFIESATVWDFSLGVETGRFRVRGYVEDAFATEDVLGIRSSGLSLSGLHVTPRPRVFGVELTAMFN